MNNEIKIRITFLEKCQTGQIRSEDLYDEFDHAVEEWHSGRKRMPLHEFLGMSQREYSKVIKNPSYLKDLLVLN